MDVKKQSASLRDTTSKSRKRPRKDRARNRGLGTVKRRRLQRRALAKSKNSYGSVDLRNELHDGLVHVPAKKLRSLDIDKTFPMLYADALVGFDESNGYWRPEIDGIVIAKLDEARLKDLMQASSSSVAVRARLKKNKQLDISRGRMKGLMHFRGERLQPIARKHGIDYVIAVVGWEYGYRGRRKAITDGILVHSADADKLTKAIQEHEARNSPAVRQKRRQAAEQHDKRQTEEFANAIRQRFPSMPEGEEFVIAEHAREKGSGRVGRSRTANDPVGLAVVAHVRWNHTNYPEILDETHEQYRNDREYRRSARDAGLSPAEEAKGTVRGKVAAILRSWQTKPEISAESADAEAAAVAQAMLQEGEPVHDIEA